MYRPRRGFTLIELLVVLVVLGIITAIAISSVFSAIQRAKQKKSMADMRTLALGLETYQIDYSHYPPASAFTLPSGLPLPTLLFSSTVPYLSPTYLKTVPLTDGWDSWFTYSTTPSRSDYAIRSNGRDGLPESAPAMGATTSFDADIIYSNGAFLQFPYGVQK